ncbi:hypothetical protein B0J11DRAFT_536229 [Dendryphion nanum]|uniref:Uncharacterized protein n=1 Tax=Dendryphion nanum TaxID=256645 RepID=A0A9P9DE77_9PLEO|nr:hypothetical protein B0J11DRAFT_536229 [Dendryphion nanum]
MASLATALGLRGSNPPSLAGAYLIFHFMWAYGITSSRTLKQIYGLDHNVSPREDLAKYGSAAVSSGKITQRQLDMLKRNESAHANSYENFPVFVGAILWAHVAGLDNVQINGSALVYTVIRIVYVAVYILVDTPKLSQLRGVCWWIGNVTCLRLFWQGMLAINASKS